MHPHTHARACAQITPLHNIRKPPISVVLDQFQSRERGVASSFGRPISAQDYGRADTEVHGIQSVNSNFPLIYSLNKAYGCLSITIWANNWTGAPLMEERLGIITGFFPCRD
jgi:hypothetical protein